MANQWETEAANTAANNAAQQAYNQGMLELGRADLAFKKAQQAWKETMDKAGITGTYEGMPTQQALQYGAESFGVWGAPQQGQTTLAKQQQDWSQAAQNAALYGSNVGQGGPAAGTQTLAGQEQGFSQGQRTQQEQRAAQAQQQSQAQQYLQLLSTLRGPADWAKYQQVLGSTPNGMRDLVGAAMGQYVPGGGATTGVNPEAVSLQSMMGQVTGQGYNPAAAGQPLNMPDVYGQNSQGMYGQQPQQQYTNQYQPQAPRGQVDPQAAAAQQQVYTQQMNPMQAQVQQMFQPPSGGNEQMTGQYGAVGGAAKTQQMLAGQLNPQAASQQAYTQQMPQTNQAVNAMGNGTNTMGATQPQAPQPNLPAPNQIAPQSWNNLAPSQKEMLLGQYEAQGWHKPDVEALRNQALPKYAANAPTAGTFRLQR